MNRKAKICINLTNLKYNYNMLALHRKANNILVVLKANAYNHGAKECASFLSDVTNGFAVAFIEEAFVINSKKQVVILQGVNNKEELQEAKHNGFDIVVHNDYQLDLLNNVNFNNNVFLKYDTGMHRLGFSDSQIENAYKKILEFTGLKPVVTSHFAFADLTDEESARKTQLSFNKVQNFALKHKLKMSINNSASFCNYDFIDDFSRIGIAMFGGIRTTLNLKPVMSLFANIIAIKTVNSGESVSYAGDFVCKRDSKIAVLNIGYADGYPRNCNKKEVFVCGKKAMVVGNVCMDMLMIDITDIPEAKLFDKVELFGDNIKVYDLADQIKTISYQILTSIKSTNYQFTL